MRIAYVTETWPPEINGVSLGAARCVSFLRGRGHAVRLVRPARGDGLPEPADPDTLTVRGVPIPLYRSLQLGLPRSGQLDEAFARGRSDLVHVATEGPLGWQALAAARRAGIACSADFRTRFDAYARHYAGPVFEGLALAYLRAFHRRAQLTFVPTEALRRHLASLGFGPLAVCGRGVDGARFSPARRSAALRERWGAHGPVLLMVGRLAAEKNLALGVKSWHAVRARHPDARLVVVGDGPQSTWFAQRCPDAIRTGELTGTALAEHYASADLFLFPSLTETFGNVCLEAAASGLAIVAFDTGAAGAHLRDGLDACVVSPHDEDGFVQAAVGLAGDPAHCARLGRAARRTAERLDWTTILAGFEHRLGELVGRARASAPALAVQ